MGGLYFHAVESTTHRWRENAILHSKVASRIPTGQFTVGESSRRIKQIVRQFSSCTYTSTEYICWQGVQWVWRRSHPRTGVAASLGRTVC